MSTPKARAASAGEFSRIAELARVLGGVKSRAVEVGIGDDAAVLRGGKRSLVVTVDDQVEGVHFDRRWLTWEDVGYRALQAAASDLAAMGADPTGAVASLHLPRGFSDDYLRRMTEGQAQAARELGCPVVGGNMSRGAVLSITTTVLGHAARPVLRSGARVGDELWVVGQLGLARAGLRLHQTRLRVPKRLQDVAQAARQAWARPRALLAAGRRLRGRARALIDISDGLSGDVQHLATASRVRAVIEAGRLSALVPEDLADLGDLLGEPGTALALQGGEDYALLAAGPKEQRPPGARVVGRIERGSGSELELPNGRRLALGPGFDHWRG